MRKKGKKKNPWADHLTHAAKKEGYAARSVYKLQEIDRRCKILRPGKKVLDLGCSPGSWLQFIAKAVGPGGRVTGLDLSPAGISATPNMRILNGDITDPEGAWRRELDAPFDAVVSDMAPNTSGIKTADALRSVALCESALVLADEVLAPGGDFVVKIFQGEGFDGFLAQVKDRFEKVRIVRPEAVRKASREVYIVGTGKKAPREVARESE